MPRWVFDASAGKNVTGARAGGGPRINLKTSFDLVGDWEAALRTQNLKLDDAIEMAVRQEAALAEGMMKENLTRGGKPAGAPFAALSPWTRAARRLAKPPIKGSKPLIARGDLRNSITHVVTGSGRSAEGFVGVLRSSGNKANIAQVQEFGKTIVVRMTPKMIRFLAVLAKAAKLPPRPKSASKSGKRFLVIHVPARPFIRPTFAVWSKDARFRFLKRISVLTNGAVGSP